MAANAALEAKVRELDEAKREAEVWQPANLASSIGGYVWNATVKAFEVVSSATHHLTHNRRSRPGVYSALESEQMRTIHEYYKRYIAPTLPELLEVTGPDYASSATASPPKPRTFHLRSWQHKLGDGFLRPLAQEALAHVCSYQVERHARIAGAGYPDDPTNLLLTELKTWLVAELSVAPRDSPTAVDSLRNRIKFLRDLVNASIFPVGTTSSIHLVTVLNYVLSLLTEAHAAFAPEALERATVAITFSSPPTPPSSDDDGSAPRRPSLSAARRSSVSSSTSRE